MSNERASEELFLASAHSKSLDGYAQSVRVGKHTLIADEPEAHGGSDTGAAPYGLLLASLSACTAITLKMYAARKGWSLGEVKIDLRMFRKGEDERIERRITIAEKLPEDALTRLREIAEKTPVTKTLKRTLAIATDVTLA